MERLSERFMFYSGLLAAYKVTKNIDINAEDLKHIQDLIDAEEQGLLLRLPCPFGTKIYCIHNGFIEEGMFFEMSCFKFKDYYKKSWFLTKEEAEQALKQMGE